MTKKTYENPTIQVIALCARDIVLTSNTYGLNNTLDADEVDEAW